MSTIDYAMGHCIMIEASAIEIEATAAWSLLAMAKRDDGILKMRAFLIDDIHPQTLDVVKPELTPLVWVIVDKLKSVRASVNGLWCAITASRHSRWMRLWSAQWTKHETQLLPVWQ